MGVVVGRHINGYWSVVVRLMVMDFRSNSYKNELVHSKT